MTTTLEPTAGAVEQQIGMGTDESQYLTFTLGEEHYGVDILRVQEIKGYTAVTRIPNTPEYIRGVLNLRGTIVPIIDLRTKFGMEKVEATMFTVIVVVVVRDRVMGIVVDAVSDVLNIAVKDVQPPPEFGSKVDTSFIRSIAKAGDKLITLLDIDRVLTESELACTAQTAA
jgi:purine-binding chemotaxis protein CheW